MTLQTYSKEEIDRLVAENKRLIKRLAGVASYENAAQRKRIMELETLCDPAGIVIENALLKDQTRQLDAFILNRKTRIRKLSAVLRKMLSVKGDHMTACDRTMGATHPCTCGADRARSLLTGDDT